mgnify:CR=1 FL=1|jgi:hypothetical protein
MANTPKNNTSNTNTKKNNKNVSDKDKALSYNKNVPMLIIIAVFLFFVVYHLLMSMRREDERIKHKIDTEIRKKLYYTDSY